MGCHDKKNMLQLMYGTIVLQGVLTSILNRIGGDAMENHFDFKDLMTFGLFLLALLTFVFAYCK